MFVVCTYASKTYYVLVFEVPTDSHCLHYIHCIPVLLLQNVIFFSCFMHCESFHSSWIFFNFTSNIRLAGFVQNSSALCNLGEDCSVQVIHIVVTVLVEMDFNALNYVSCLSCFAFYKVTKAHAQSLCSGCENHFGLSVAFFILVTMSMVCLICIPTQLKLDAGDPNDDREYSWCNLRGKARLFKLHMFYLKFRWTQTIGHFSSM